MQVQLINNHGGGFADRVRVEPGTTAQALFARTVPHGRAEDYLIRVNRLPVSPGYVLEEGDSVSITPTKIEGARR